MYLVRQWVREKMDVPNAPNPINPNPNAQDQFMDVVQGPTNPNQNVPVQPPNQLVPAQPVPTGLVVSAPQVFYQNWIRKKPEFSGKPEEDAESHLLSTTDWMEAHNFPNEVKVRHFCLTLTGEARLWYELLAPLENDWPALQTNLDGNIQK